MEVLKTLKYKEAKWPYPWRAFRLFGVSTLVLFLIVCDFLMTWFAVDDERKIYYIISVGTLAVYLNYRWCWKGDIYRKYFQKFKKKGYDNWDYLVALMFYFGILGFVVLSALGLEFV